MGRGRGVGGAAAGSAAIAAVALGVGAIALATYLWLRRRGRFARFADTSGRWPGPRSCSRSATESRSASVARDLVPRRPDVRALRALYRRGAAACCRALAVVVLASLVAAIPAAPGYAGTFDAGIIVGLRAVGVEGGDAVGVLLLARFMWFVPPTIVGLAVLVLGYGGRLRRSPPDDQELLAEQPPGERRRR